MKEEPIVPILPTSPLLRKHATLDERVIALVNELIVAHWNHDMHEAVIYGATMRHALSQRLVLFTPSLVPHEMLLAIARSFREVGWGVEYETDSSRMRFFNRYLDTRSR